MYCPAYAFDCIFFVLCFLLSLSSLCFSRVDPHSMNSLSSRWLRSASALLHQSQHNSPPRLSSYELYQSSESQYAPALQDATVTLPTPGRRNKTLKGRHYRDLSLPSLNVDHFVTVARRKARKSSFRSPCAQKIAAQRERERELDRGRQGLSRSSSLLCLGMDCRGILDDLQSVDYEDVWSEDWKHSSLINLHTDIPDPPPFQPPAPPTSAPNQPTVDYSIRPPMPVPQDEQQFSMPSTHTLPSELSPQNSSSGNSTLTGSDEEDKEIYMVVSDHHRELRKTITRSQSRKQVSRSLTWASPANRPCSFSLLTQPPVTDKCTNNMLSMKSNHFRKSRSPPRYAEQSYQKSNQHFEPSQSSHPTHYSSSYTSSKTNTSPPLPPRKRSSRPQCPLPQDQLDQDASEPQEQHYHMNSWQYGGNLNILNYSDYMNRRLKCPEGASRLDQVSYTTGNLCGPWYDLWADDPSVADV